MLSCDCFPKRKHNITHFFIFCVSPISFKRNIKPWLTLANRAYTQASIQLVELAIRMIINAMSFLVWGETLKLESWEKKKGKDEIYYSSQSSPNSSQSRRKTKKKPHHPYYCSVNFSLDFSIFSVIIIVMLITIILTATAVVEAA